MIEFVIGIGVGLLIYYVFGARRTYDGAYVIDFSDPMKDVCRLELDGGPLEAYGKKYITLRVVSIGEDADSPN
jgi:hypothetical protein